MKRFLFLLAIASALTACGGGDPEDDQVFYGSNPLYPAPPGEFVGPPTPR